MGEITDTDRLPEELIPLVAPKLVELGGLAMQFAQVERGTADLLGNPESDTDHTVMLGLLAVALAEYDPRLDRGKVALYALVHDFVEVYAGDVRTIHQDKVDFAAKERNEKAALERLRNEYGKIFPGFIGIIDSYESLADLEATFVKTLDKSMPAITHLFNDCMSVLDEFATAEQVAENSRLHTAKLSATYGADHPLVIAVRTYISSQFIEEFRKRKQVSSESGTV